MMAQQKQEERAAIDRVLSLFEELSPEAREEVLYQLKLEDLRREIGKGIEASERGEVYTEEEVLAHLHSVRQEILERHKK